MSHHLAARRSAIAHRGRVIASLVGVLALVVALFATAASAGVRSPRPSHATKPPAGKPAPPAHAPQDADENPADKPAAKPPVDDHKPAGKPKDDEDDEQGKPDEDDENEAKPAGCDSSGPGNPCHPPQACGQNSGPGNANDQCPPEDHNACVAGDEGRGPAAGDDVKGAHHKGKGHGESHAKHKGKGHKGNDADEDDDAECVPPRGPNCGVEGKPACGEDNQPVCGVEGKPTCDNNNPPVEEQQPQQQPQPNTTVAGQQAPATQPAANQPTTAVAGTQAASATARIRAQTRCGTRSFRVTISGRQIRRVTLFVAGRRVRTVTVPAGRRSITVSVPVRRFGARRQSVRARVTFRNGAPARTLTASATRCAQTEVSPQFTG